MQVWELLHQYVKDFEIANNCQFSDEAWQRIKQLERDIQAHISDIENKHRIMFLQSLEKSEIYHCDACNEPYRLVSNLDDARVWACPVCGASEGETLDEEFGEWVLVDKRMFKDY